jgi:hypothetical protein
MIYTVVSLQQAENELALIWMQAANPQAVTDASNRIDVAPRRDAHQKGSLLDDGSRLYIDSPLAATFVVSQDDCLVTIKHFEEA